MRLAENLSAGFDSTPRLGSSNICGHQLFVSDLDLRHLPEKVQTEILLQEMVVAHGKQKRPALLLSAMKAIVAAI
ncbi:MAG: hypothetical protein IPK73_24295 [Candidatus Obscuribacter sp.]|nr:hypothetical protein [Candidatus Obscuribacter sp.]MBK9277238.1 hypothetical protein [Candidatus Obscuribacter sp.]